jgi:hypothetical protein
MGAWRSHAKLGELRSWDEDLAEHSFDHRLVHWLGIDPCGNGAADFEQGRLGFAPMFDEVCASPAVTPQGLRFHEAPGFRDALGRDPSDQWIFDYAIALARRGRRPIPEADVHFTFVGQAPEHEPLRRALLRRRREIRRCYELGGPALPINLPAGAHSSGKEAPDPAGDIVVLIQRGAGGRTQAMMGGGEHPPPRHVGICITRALDGIGIASMEQPWAWTYRVELRRRPGGGSRTVDAASAERAHR